MVQIRWLKEAKDDLKEIFDYISSDSVRYAKLQVDTYPNGSSWGPRPNTANKVIRDTH